MDRKEHRIEQSAICQFRYVLHDLEETVSQGLMDTSTIRIGGERKMHNTNLLLTDLLAAFPSSSQAEIQTASPPLVPL